MSIPQRSIYSYEWGQNVVQAFVERYARGTYFVAKMLDISHEDLCFRLIEEVRLDIQQDWEASKIVIKRSCREHFRDFDHIGVKERRKYLSLVKQNAKEDYYSEHFAQNELNLP